jgi:4-amino-4-deoxy-L-arabinose transferase-like glycosyltransferase
MFDRNDWVTPWIYFQGELKPYQGKPPLHFWLMEICYSIFGVTVWSARLPSALSAVVIGVLLFVVARIRLGTHAALAAVSILATSTLLFFLAGGCVLDVTLTAGVTLSLVSFALADRSKLWSTLFFVGLGLGVLVKGPLAIALVGLTICPWALLYRWGCGCWPVQLRSLQWIQGVSAFVLIVAPWYLIQEFRNPGFLRYFIWNENLARYLIKDYGDAYGTGHVQPFGASWLMLFIGLSPWSFLVLPWFATFRSYRDIPVQVQRWIVREPWAMFGALWMVSCPLLFTFARQYTPTYFVTSVPGFALLVAAGWRSLILGTEWSSTRFSSACRYTVIILGLVSITGGLASLRFDAPWLAVIAACLVGIALVHHGAQRTQFTEMLSSVSRVTLATGVVYFLVVACFSEHISLKRSSRRALQMAQDAFPHKRELTIGFPFYYPFSATFYDTTIAGGSFTTMLLDAKEIPAAPVDALLVRGHDNAKKFQELFPQRKVIAQQGRWTLFEGATVIDK